MSKARREKQREQRRQNRREDRLDSRNAYGVKDETPQKAVKRLRAAQ